MLDQALCFFYTIDNMDAFTSVESGWFEDPYVLSCEVAVRHEKSLPGFENLFAIAIAIFLILLTITVVLGT